MPRGPDGHGPVICRGLPGTSGSGCVTSVQQCNANDRSLAFLHLGCHDPRPRRVRRRRPRPRRMRTDRSTGPASRGTAGRACARYRGGRGRGNPGPDHRPGSGPAASSAAPRPTRRRRVPRPRCRYMPVMSVTRVSRSPRPVLWHRAAAGGRGGPGLPGGGVGAAVRQRSRWLRRTLADPGFSVTEAAVLALGAATGLLGAAAPWFVLLLVHGGADTESPDEPLSVVGVACSGSRAARYPDVCPVIASLRHPGHRGCVVRCRKRTPRCALVPEPWSAGPGPGAEPLPMAAARSPPRTTPTLTSNPGRNPS